MYHVSSIPRPPLGRLLLQCVWFGASRGALYGLICGAGYGVFFYVVGALIGGPVGLVFGTVVGALDGLICGVILHRRVTIFTAELDQATISSRVQTFRGWMGAFTFLACLIGGYLVTSSGHDFALRNVANIASLLFVVVPSLIAGVCGYAATGRLLRWYVRRWVFAPPKPMPREYSGERLV